MAEDFYRSLGLPKLPDSFWEKSVFSRRTYESARCHGSAADMYKQDDYRLVHWFLARHFAQCNIPDNPGHNAT